MNDPRDGLPGLTLETAASVVLRDTIQQHMAQFAHVIRTDKACGQAVSAAYIDGLAGALALIVAGGESREQVLLTVRITLESAVNRDLRHLRKI